MPGERVASHMGTESMSSMVAGCWLPLASGVLISNTPAQSLCFTFWSCEENASPRFSHIRRRLTQTLPSSSFTASMASPWKGTIRAR